MGEPKLAIGILGATGAVGQKLVALLDRHPCFEVAALSASARSAGRPYREVVHWLEGTELPAAAGALVVQSAAPPLPCDLVISALDAPVAREAEPAFAAAGYPVVSNASAFRMHPRVPLLVPEVNPDHLALLDEQDHGHGFLVTNPNCATVGLVAALKPLDDAFGVAAVEVTTLQAVSGAGYPGVASLDILGNVIPHITGEEEKLRSEPAKILGRLVAGSIQPAPIRVSAQVTRVPVLDGHLLSVSVALRQRATPAAARAALSDYRPATVDLALPSAPASFLHVFDTDDSPQPRRHAALGSGMTVSIGRLRACPVLDLRFVALVHNTVRGAAGAAILNAELLLATGRLHPRRRDCESPAEATLGPFPA